MDTVKTPTSKFSIQLNFLIHSSVTANDEKLSKVVGVSEEPAANAENISLNVYCDSYQFYTKIWKFDYQLWKYSASLILGKYL